MPGKCSFFSASEPYSSRVGPKNDTPMPPIGLRAPTLAISSFSTLICSRLSPPPPTSLGQWGTPQPLAPSARRHALASALSGLACSLASCTSGLPASALGKLASSHSRTSARKVSTSLPKSAITLLLLEVREAQHPLGHDVQVHFRGC